MLRRLFHRLRASLRRRKIERELDRELQFHLEMETAENVRRGMSEEEARRVALRSFGGVERTREDYRDIARFRRLEELWQDARYGARMLLKTPGFTAAAGLTLALGVGANTAVFSVVYATLLKPLPYPEAERIYGVEILLPERNLSVPGRIQDYLEWRKESTAFSSIAALQTGGWNLTGNGEPERVGGANVSTNFFEFLGVPPALGRGFAPEEEAPGADRVVVISDALWRRRYAADPNLVGRTIELDGQDHVVVGIAAPSLLVPTGTQLHSWLLFPPRIDIWKPIAPTKAELEEENFNTALLLRLKANESAEHGRRQIEGFYLDYGRRVAPEMKVSIAPRFIPIREVYSGKFRTRLLLVFAASTILLLGVIGVYGVVSLSVANRTREIGLRMALGASPRDVMRWVFTRGLRPVIIGAFAGLLSAVIVATSLRSLLFAVAPTDPFSLVAVALILLCASLLACYLPARRAAGLNPVDLLRN